MLRPALLPWLALVACAPSIDRRGNEWAGFELELEDGKREDDQRVAKLADGNVRYQKISFPSSDGLPLPAYLFSPLKRSGKSGPALIFLHGGEHGTFSSRRVPRVMPMVRRGWTVLALDYRGSSGYGSVFHDAADYGGREIDDVVAAKAWLVEHGNADRQKVAVMGFSHGGYMAALAVARHPDAFAASIDFYGPTDLVYRVTSSPEENPNAAPGDPAKFARMVGATLAENEQAYRDRSPRFLAHRIRTPLLIVHGTEDRIVNIRESEWLADALRKAGHRDFEFLRVVGGKHGYPRERYREAWERALRFLDERVGR